MTSPIEIIKVYLTKVFSDLHNIILGAVVAASILAGGGIYLFAQKLWTQLTDIAQSPTPLWVSAILVLGVMEYIYIRVRLNSKQQPPKPIHRFIDEGDLRWKVYLKTNGGFRLDNTPLCVKHDVQLLSFNDVYLCQLDGKDGTEECKTVLFRKDHDFRKQCAESLAEKKFR